MTQSTGSAPDIGHPAEPAAQPAGSPGASDVSSRADPAARVDEPAGPSVGLTVFGLGVVVAAGVALGWTAHVGALPLLIAVAVVQAVFVPSWIWGSGMPGRAGALVVAALAAAGADVCVSLWPHSRLGPLLAVVGLTVPVMFVQQLARGAARSRMVASLSGTSVAVLVGLALPALMPLRHEFTGATEGGRVCVAVVAAVAAALIAGGLVDLVVPLPRFDPLVRRGLLGVLAAAIVGGAVGYAVLRHQTDFAGGRAVAVGGGLGLLAGLLAVGAAFALHGVPRADGAVRRVQQEAARALLPVCVLAPIAFLICLAIRG